MSRRHTPGKRDLYTSLTAALTGVAVFGSLAGTGYAVGAIAHQHDLEQQRRDDAAATAAAATAQGAPAPAQVRTIVKRRPHRTVVHTQVIHRAPVSVSVGSGGTISSSASSSYPASSTSSGSTRSTGGSSSHTTSSTQVTNPAPRPAAQPKPAAAPQPAPKPAPAPSSGS